MLMSFCETPRNTTHVGHTQCVSQAREASVTAGVKEGDSDVETALAALAGKSDIDLEETDVQEILLANKESRQLLGEQRVNRGYRPVTMHTSGGKPSRVESRLNIHEPVAASVARRDIWARECPNKGKQVLKDGD